MKLETELLSVSSFAESAACMNSSGVEVTENFSDITFCPVDKPAGHHQDEAMKSYSRSRYDPAAVVALDRPCFLKLNRRNPADRDVGT
jgi:hypothetical protein